MKELTPEEKQTKPTLTKEEQQKINKIASVIVLGIALFIVFKFFAGSSSETNVAQSPEISVQPSKVEVYAMSKEFVKKQLKSPSTAKFPTYSDDFVTDMGENKFLVASYVDAENSFGAKVRTRYSCILQYIEETGKWQLEDIKLEE